MIDTILSCTYCNFQGLHQVTQASSCSQPGYNCCWQLLLCNISHGWGEPCDTSVLCMTTLIKISSKVMISMISVLDHKCDKCILYSTLANKIALQMIIGLDWLFLPYVKRVRQIFIMPQITISYLKSRTVLESPHHPTNDWHFYTCMNRNFVVFIHH